MHVGVCVFSRLSCRRAGTVSRVDGGRQTLGRKCKTAHQYLKGFHLQDLEWRVKKGMMGLKMEGEKPAGTIQSGTGLKRHIIDREEETEETC